MCWSSAPAPPACTPRSGGARRRAGAAGRPQPDRPRRRDGHGADDGGRRGRRGRAGPLAAPPCRYARRGPRAVRRALSRLCCARTAPACIREMDAWGVGWARKDGHLAPGAGAGPRPAALRLRRFPQYRSGGLEDAACAACSARRTCGASAICWSRSSRYATASASARTRCICRRGEPVPIAAKATIVATGGLTRLYARNSASINMGGDGYALALRAGAELIDMEFVQFFPIGHLAPRLVGMDPIMWDPFRYKLGGRLLNAERREFLARGRRVYLAHATSPPTPSSRRSPPAAARRTAASGSPSSIAASRSCARRSGRSSIAWPRMASTSRASRSRSRRSRITTWAASRGRAHADPRAASLCRGRGGRRRQWRQSPVRQCDHRGAGVRPAGRRAGGGARGAHGDARALAPRSRLARRRADVNPGGGNRAAAGS